MCRKLKNKTFLIAPKKVTLTWSINELTNSMLGCKIIMKVFVYRYFGDEIFNVDKNWFEMDETKLIHTEKNESVFSDIKPTEIRLTKKGNYVINKNVKGTFGYCREVWTIITKQEVDRIIKNAKEDKKFHNSLEV